MLCGVVAIDVTEGEVNSVGGISGQCEAVIDSPAHYSSSVVCGDVVGGDG